MMICKHCKKSHCYTHCQETTDGKHVPILEFENSSATRVLAQFDFDSATRDGITIDIMCSKCGVSGSTQVLFKDLEW